jgi:dihydrofolate reductase
MKISVFCGVSVDGFLARPNGALDFLAAGEKEQHGFEEFFESVKQVVVLSTHALDFSTIQDAVVQQMSGEPDEIIKKLRERGFQHVYIDGGVTIQRFLTAGVLERLVITRVPVLIGEGIPLFGLVPHDINLQHVETRCFGGGLVQSEYLVRRVKGLSN